MQNRHTSAILARTGEADLRTRVLRLERELCSKDDEIARLRSVVKDLTSELLSERTGTSTDGAKGLGLVVQRMNEENTRLKEQLLRPTAHTNDEAGNRCSWRSIPASVVTAPISQVATEPEREKEKEKDEGTEAQKSALVSAYDEVALFELYRRDGNIGSYACAPKHVAVKHLPQIDFGPPPVHPPGSPVWDVRHESAAINGTVVRPIGAPDVSMVSICPAGTRCADANCKLHHTVAPGLTDTAMYMK